MRGQPVVWSPEMDDRLMECMENGLSLGKAARELGVTENAATARFRKRNKEGGWQYV